MGGITPPINTPVMCIDGTGNIERTFPPCFACAFITVVVFLRSGDALHQHGAQQGHGRGAVRRRNLASSSAVGGKGKKERRGKEWLTNRAHVMEERWG
jgi:hypothetical protein